MPSAMSGTLLVIYFDLFMPALLLNHIIALKKTTRAPRVHLVDVSIPYSSLNPHTHSCDAAVVDKVKGQ